MAIESKPRKPRITIEASGMTITRFVFVVRFPGKGWKTRRCLSWNEALFAAGLIDLTKEVPL